MQFFDAVKIAFKKYADFRGAATRPEFWWFTLFVFLVGLMAGSLDMAFRQESGGPIQSLVSVALFLPQITIMVRRNRDAGVSAWWLTLWVMPIGILIASIASNIDVLSKYTQISNFESLSQQEFIASLVPLVGVVLPSVIAMFAVSLFFFVVSLLPSKKPKQQPVVATIDY